MALPGIFIPRQIHGEQSSALQIPPPEPIKNPLEALSETPTPSEIKEAIVFLAINKELGKDFYQTLFCESSLRYNAVGDGGKAYGVAQYHKPTWDYFNKLRGTNLNYKNTAHQLEMTAWAFKNKLQGHWTCWNNLYNKKPRS